MRLTDSSRSYQSWWLISLTRLGRTSPQRLVKPTAKRKKLMNSSLISTTVLTKCVIRLRFPMALPHSPLPSAMEKAQ